MFVLSPAALLASKLVSNVFVASSPSDDRSSISTNKQVSTALRSFLLRKLWMTDSVSLAALIIRIAGGKRGIEVTTGFGQPHSLGCPCDGFGKFLKRDRFGAELSQGRLSPASIRRSEPTAYPTLLGLICER